MLVGFSSQWTSPWWIVTVYWIRPSVHLCHLECPYRILMVFLTLILRFPEVKWMSQAGYPRFVDLLTRYLFWNFYLTLCDAFSRASADRSRVLSLFAFSFAFLCFHYGFFLLIILLLYFYPCSSCLSRQDLTTWYVINKINTPWSNSFPLVNITLSCSNGIASLFLSLRFLQACLMALTIRTYSLRRSSSRCRNIFRQSQTSLQASRAYIVTIQHTDTIRTHMMPTIFWIRFQPHYSQQLASQRLINRLKRHRRSPPHLCTLYTRLSIPP